MSRRVKMIAGASLPFEGRRLRVGEEFEASEGDAADLVAMGFASESIEQIVKGELTSETSRADLSPAKPRGRYRRRDMRAEK